MDKLSIRIIIGHGPWGVPFLSEMLHLAFTQPLILQKSTRLMSHQNTNSKVIFKLNKARMIINDISLQIINTHMNVQHEEVTIFICWPENRYNHTCTQSSQAWIIGEQHKTSFIWQKLSLAHFIDLRADFINQRVGPKVTFQVQQTWGFLEICWQFQFWE